VQAGELLRIAQPRVSDLARGRLGKFSLEKLLQFARLAGIDVGDPNEAIEQARPEGQDQGGLESGPGSRGLPRKGSLVGLPPAFR